jgi:hypothetical protein
VPVLYESLTRDVDREIRGEHASWDHAAISRDFAHVVARQFSHCGHLARFLHRGSPSQEPERVEHAVGSGNALNGTTAILAKWTLRNGCLPVTPLQEDATRSHSHDVDLRRCRGGVLYDS